MKPDTYCKVQYSVTSPHFIRLNCNTVSFFVYLKLWIHTLCLLYEMKWKFTILNIISLHCNILLKIPYQYDFSWKIFLVQIVEFQEYEFNYFIGCHYGMVDRCLILFVNPCDPCTEHSEIRRFKGFFMLLISTCWKLWP